MADPGAVEQAQRAEAHVHAAVLGTELNSAQAPINVLRDVWKKKGAPAMFQEEAREKLDEEKPPNFAEIHKILGSLPAANAVETAEKVRLQTKAQLLQEIVDGKPAGTIAVGANPAAQERLLAKVAATLPGLTTILAKETGMPISVIRNALDQGTFNNAGPLGNVMRRLLKDEQFIRSLSKTIGENVIYNDEFLTLDAGIAHREAEIQARQNGLNAEKGLYTNAANTGAVDIVQNMQIVAPATYNALRQDLRNYNVLQTQLLNTRIDDSIKPTGEVSRADTVNQLNTILARFQSFPGLAGRGIGTATPAIGGAFTREMRDECNELKRAHGFLTQIQALYNNNANLETDFQNFRMYDEYQKTKRGQFDATQKQINDEKVNLAKDKVKRDALRNDYVYKFDRVLNKTMKDYYNDVVLKQADDAAQAEAKEKTDVKKKEEDEKKKREEAAQEVLKRFLRMSFLQYRGGKVAGFDDRALKDFVHREMFRKSPAELAKGLLQRIYLKSGQMPPQFRNELLKTLQEDMGLGTGVPPLTFNQVLNKLDKGFLETIAKERVPDTLGYAMARGYYFDRMKFTKAQQQYLEQAYKEDFFADALVQREKYITEAQKLLKVGDNNENMLTGGENLRRQVKDLLGKDWVGGSKRLGTVVAAAALLAAPLYGASIFASGAGAGWGEGLVIAGKGAAVDIGAKLGAATRKAGIATGVAASRVAAGAAGLAESGADFVVKTVRQ